jgi:hypothetical protein
MSVNDRMRIVIATRSSHKLGELAGLLRPERAELVTLDALGIEGDPVEDGATFEANARLKARYYARLTRLPTIADDSGIEVDALGGEPGIRTRRYAGEAATDTQNNAKLLAALAGLPATERGARSPPRRAVRSGAGSSANRADGPDSVTTRSSSRSPNHPAAGRSDSTRPPRRPPSRTDREPPGGSDRACATWATEAWIGQTAEAGRRVVATGCCPAPCLGQGWESGWDPGSRQGPPSGGYRVG